jgi:hypothetical protein
MTVPLFLCHNVYTKTCPISTAGVNIAAIYSTLTASAYQRQPLLDDRKTGSRKSKGGFNAATEAEAATIAIDWSAAMKVMKALSLPQTLHQSKMLSTFVGV